MRELIYTKQRLEYAYFLKTEQGIQPVDVDAFTAQEQRLMSVSSIGMRSSEEVSGTDAVFFDKDTQQLKYVRWEYSTERDPRGYVEAVFRCLDDPSVQTVGRSSLFGAELCSMLTETAAEGFQGNAFICVNRATLFDAELPEKTAMAVLKLIFLMLPGNIASRVIFLNRGSRKPLLHTSGFAENAPFFRDTELLMLSMLQQSRNQEQYLWLLYGMMRDLFGTETIAENRRMKPPQLLKLLLSVWENTLNQPLRMLMKVYDNSQFIRVFRNAFSTALDTFWQESKPNELCDAYARMLPAAMQFQDTVIFSDLREKMIIHTHRNDLYERDIFLLLYRLRNTLFPEDLHLYAEKCANRLLQSQTADELVIAAASLSETVPAAEQAALLCECGRKKEMTVLCTQIQNHSLEELGEYQGVCTDDQFEPVRAHLQFTGELWAACGFDFAAALRQDYVMQCSNPIRCQRLMPFYLDASVPLEWLEKLLGAWIYDDFYIPLHPDLYRYLAGQTSVQLAEMPRYHSFIELTEQYVPVAALMYELCMKSMRSGSADEEDSKAQLSSLSQLVPPLLDIYMNVLANTGKETEFLIRLMTKTLFANPVTLVLLADTYIKAYNVKTPKALRGMFQSDTNQNDVTAFLIQPVTNSTDSQNLHLNGCNFLDAVFDKENGLFSRHSLHFTVPDAHGSGKSTAAFLDMLFDHITAVHSLSRSQHSDLRCELSDVSLIYRSTVEKLVDSQIVRRLVECIKSMNWSRK